MDNRFSDGMLFSISALIIVIYFSVLAYFLSGVIGYPPVWSTCTKSASARNIKSTCTENKIQKRHRQRNGERHRHTE